ncbi:hypothetical protein HMPREF3192_01360 [Atopobium deltae]|uniref:Uncharacterized protein n=1 Tax=Atopobium deltae TaxID=1393034 RepID=A0A133XPX3_9ACTN|nr:hypothetical protein HMPREF3192_01360 [Atopobium deltae]
MYAHYALLTAAYGGHGRARAAPSRRAKRLIATPTATIFILELSCFRF